MMYDIEKSTDGFETLLKDLNLKFLRPKQKISLTGLNSDRLSYNVLSKVLVILG